MALPFTYIPNVPQGSQQINSTQQPINGNFQDIYDLFEVNHVAFNTANTFGTHNFINFVTQTTDPTTISSEIALYTKAVTDDPNGVELFYRYPNNGTVNQLTGSGATTGNSNIGTGGGIFNSTLTSNQGGYPARGTWQYLSNGILMMTWNVNNTNGIITNPFPVYFPGPSNCATTTGATMPQFNTECYNIQMAATNPQGIIGVTTNYAITITSKSTANLYWTGTSNGTQGSIVCTAIGI